MRFCRADIASQSLLTLPKRNATLTLYLLGFYWCLLESRTTDPTTRHLYGRAAAGDIGSRGSARLDVLQVW